MGKPRQARDSRRSVREEPAAPRVSRWRIAPHPALAALALFLVIAGARWWLIGGYGVDVPWLDQWDAEAQGLYQPRHAGTMTPAAWFAPHNEHRILFTRLLAAGLLGWNGQWDPRLQMVVNAGLYAAIAGGLFLALRKGRSPAFQVFCWILLATLGTAPYAATNTLLGFQSQFYFLAGFSLVAIYALVNGRPGSLWWIAGVVSGCAAIFSMASGYAAAIAVLGVLLGAGLRAENGVAPFLKLRWATALAAAGLIAVGLAASYTPPQNASFAAKSAGDFLGLLIACLSWPGKPMIVLPLLTWLPFAMFVAQYLRRQTDDDATARFVLGVGLWVLLQAAALAIFRANSGEGLESRYTDILAFGLLANAICAVRLLASGGPVRRFMPALATVYFAVTGISLYLASVNDTAFAWKRDMEIRRAATAGFLSTGDQRYLEQAPPYPDANRLATLLAAPAIRPILPAGIRPTLLLAPRNGSPAPDFIPGLSTPDLASVTPGVWTSPGMFTRFAVIPPSAPFEYRVEKKSALPFLLVYLLGNAPDLTVSDSRGAQHGIIPLPFGADRRGRHAVVYCPTAECVLKGSGGPSQAAVGEPKEVGILSIAALTAALCGFWLMLAAAIAFAVLVALSIARSRRPDHLPTSQAFSGSYST